MTWKKRKQGRKSETKREDLGKGKHLTCQNSFLWQRTLQIWKIKEADPLMIQPFTLVKNVSTGIRWLSISFDTFTRSIIQPLCISVSPAAPNLHVDMRIQVDNPGKAVTHCLQLSMCPSLQLFLYFSHAPFLCFWEFGNLVIKRIWK
jgi:hypothetical protein